MVLADPPYNTCSARSQTSFSHDVFCETIIENIVSLVSIMTASGAHEPFSVPACCPSIRTTDSVGRRRIKKV